jgi:penicillin-binding protein 1A
MKGALQDVEETPLKMAADMVTVRIDPDTGRRARNNQSNAIFEVFREENVPPDFGQDGTSVTAGSGVGHGGGDEDPF